MLYCDEHTCDTCPAAEPGGPCYVPDVDIPDDVELPPPPPELPVV